MLSTLWLNVPWQKKGQKAFGNFFPPSIEDKFALYLKGKEIIEKKGYRHPGMGFFVRPHSRLGKAFEEGSLKRNMMGLYGTKSNFLLGLGVSARRQVDNVFFKMSGFLEKYLFEIEKKGFATWRTHKQTKKEITTQNIFENLLNDQYCKIPQSLEQELAFLKNISFI